MKKTIIVLILSFILPIISFAVNYTSNDNNTGWWDEAGTWNGGAPANDDINLNTGNLTIYGFVKWETQNSSDSTLTFVGGGGGTLIVEDTLVIIGNLHLGNDYDLTVNGILIVYGDISSTNKITIASTGYLIVQGDMDFGGSQGEIVDGDEGNVYIGGGCNDENECAGTSNDSTDLEGDPFNVDDFYNDNDPNNCTTPAVDDIVDQTVCDSYTLPVITGTNLTGSESYYTGTGGTGTSYTAGDVISSTTTLYIYDETGTTPNCSSEESFTITVNTSPTVNDIADQTVCDSYTLPVITGTNLTGSESYYTGTGGTGTSYTAGDVISSTTTLYIYDETGTTPNCSSEESFTITVNTSPTVNDIADQTVCDSYTLPVITGTNLTGSESYYTGTGGTGTSYTAGDVISSTTTLYIYDETGTTPNCSSEESFTITVNTSPTVNDIADQTVCDSYTLPVITGTNLTGSESYYTGTGGTGTSYTAGDVISSTTTLYIYDETGTTPNCSSEESFTITVNTSPTVNDIADQTVCDSYTLPVITGTNLTGSESYYTGTGGTGTSYTAGDVISSTTTLYIYDETGTTPNCSSEESFTITVNTSPTVNDIADQTVCDSYTLPVITGTNLTGSESYYTGTGGTGTSYTAGDVISSTTTLYIYDETGTTPNCSSEESFTITVNTSPTVNDIADQTVCDSYTLPVITGTNLTGSESYYTGTGGTGTSYTAGDVISSTTTLYIYDETGTTPNCSSEESFTITVNTSPTVNDIADQTVCDSYTLPVITGTNLTGSESYYTGTGGTGTSYTAGDVISSTTTLYIYDETGTTPNCSSEESFTITVNTSPTVNDIADQTVCDSYTLPVITGTNLTGSESYYTGTGGTGTSYTAGDVISSTTTLYIYDETGTTPNCSSEESFTITVNTSPTVNDIADQTVCDSYTLPVITGTNLTGSESYYTGTGGTGTSYTAGDVISSTTTLYIYDETGTTPNCSSEESFTITVNTSPTVNDIADQTVCDSYTLPVITGTNLTGSESYYTGTGGTGTSYTAGDVISSTTTLYIYDETGTTPNCSSEESFTITVNTSPTVNDIADQTVCDSYTLPVITGTNLTGSESYYTGTGGTGTSYTAGDVISSTTTLYIYDETGTTPNCSSEESFTITVNTSPTVNDIADQTVCDSYTLPVITGTNLTGSESYYTGTGGTGTSYTAGDVISSTTTLYIYDETGTTPNCSSEESFTITVNTSPTVNDIADQTVCDSYTLPVITGTNLTGSESYYTGTGGTGTSYTAGDVISSTTTLYIYDETGTTPNCSSEESFTITVNTSPTVNDIADQTVCDSYTLPVITGTNLTGSESYYTGTGGTGTSYTAGDVISSTTTLYIYDETGTTPNCSSEESFTITVNTSPTVNDIADQTVCDSYTLPVITGTNLTGSESYYTGTGGTGTSYTAGDVISSTTTLYIYDETGTTPNCSSEESFTITVNTSPTVNDIADQTVCDSYTLPVITGTNLTGSESYYTGTGGTGTSYTAGDVISSTTTLYIYDETGTTPNCSSEESFTITVNTSPTVNDIADQTVCDSYTLPVITGTNLTGSESYYTGTGGTGTSYTAGDVISSTTTLYIYDETGTTPNCSSEESFTITVNTSPTVNDIADQTVCDSYTLPVITGTNLTGSESYYTGTGGTGTSYTAGDVISSTTTLYIYDETGTTPNCSSEESFTITVNTSPTVNDIADQTVCDSYTLPVITGTNLTGSESYYTGTGGTGTSYTAGDVISSTTTLYIYDETGTTPNCSSEESFTITVNTSPTVNDIADQTVCDSYTLPVITGTNLTGSESYYTGTGGTGTSYTAGDVISSTTTLYIYDETGTTPNCSSEESFTITVNTSPTVNDIADQTVCDSYTLPVITGTNLTGSESYYTGTGGTGTSYTAGDVISSTTTLYIYDETGTTPNCSSEESFTITVNTSPTVNDIADQTVCDSYTLPVITGTNLTGSESYYTGTGGTGTSYTAGDVISAITTLYIYDSYMSCSDEESFTITIEDTTAPTPDSGTLSDVTSECEVNSLTTPTATDNCGGTITVTNDATLPITAQGTTVVEWTYTDENGNSSTQNQNVVIDDVTAPILNAPPADITVACLGDLPAMVDLAWTDNCDGSGTVTGSDVNNGGDPITVTRTWIYTDAGGNTAAQTQTITIDNSFDVDDIADQTVCDSYTLPAITGTNLSGSEAYFTESGGTGTSYTDGDVIGTTTTLYIYDSNGSCSDEESFNITITNTPDIDDIDNQTVCDVYTLPVITGSNLSGNEAYYTGSNRSGSRYYDGEDLTSSKVLYIYDTNGSCSDQESFVVTILSSPDVDDIEDQDVCEDYTLPSITGEHLTGNEAYYTLSGGKGDRFNAGDLITSERTLYIYDAVANCSDEESFTISLRSAEVNLDEDVKICEGKEYTFSTDRFYDAYLWNDLSSESEYTTGQEGYVWVQVTNQYDCTASDTVYLTVHANPTVDLGNDTVLCGNESLEIDAGDFSLYDWSTGDVSSSVTVYAGEQEIDVLVTDENGCTGSDTILILPCEESVLGEITNVFTPNNDGVHDTWIINGIELYPDAKIEVFDRTQRRVFYKKGNYNNSEAWDGTYNGKELPMGNYYYVIDLDGEKVLKGYVTIIK